MDTRQITPVQYFKATNNLRIVACLFWLLVGYSEAGTSVKLISDPVDLIPGPESVWTGKAALSPGPWELTITYGEGGIVNEGYPGFPGSIYSPYPNGRGCARLQVMLDLMKE